MLSGSDPTRPTRLLQLLDFDPPQGGSFVPIIAAMLSEAKLRGWDIGVVLFESEHEIAWVDDLRAIGADITLVPRGSDRAISRHLRALLEGYNGQTLMHSHFHGFDIASLLARRHSRSDAIVWHVHSVFPTDVIRRLTSTVKFGVVARGVDAFYCPAGNIVDSTVRRLAPRDRVKFVPSAINVQRFRGADAAFRAEARRDLDVPEGPVALLHFGWHRHLKGGDVFIDMVAELLRRGVDVIAMERGGDEVYMEQARELGIEEHVVLVPPTDDVRELHASADVFVSPSRNEGMAYALLETLCVGTPVIATGISGHAYLAEHIDACRLAELDPVALVDAVEATLARPEEQVEAERRQAEDWIAQNLSVEVVARSVVDDYESLLAARP